MEETIMLIYASGVIVGLITLVAFFYLVHYVRHISIVQKRILSLKMYELGIEPDINTEGWTCPVCGDANKNTINVCECKFERIPPDDSEE